MFYIFSVFQYFEKYEKPFAYRNSFYAFFSYLLVDF